MYTDYAHEWWNDKNSKFRSLQRISKFKIELINEWIGDVSGLNIVDLGCGGGLISIPLIEMGANLTGIDISDTSIKVAIKKSKLGGKFFVRNIKNTELPDDSSDLVILADVLDHIEDYPKILEEASRITKKGGLIFVSTINRTILSKIFALYLGEGFGFIPKGTHDYKLFIRPHELINNAKLFGLKQIKIQGEFPKVFSTLIAHAICFRKSTTQALAYSILFQKDIS